VNDHTHIGVTSLQRIRNPHQQVSTQGINSWVKIKPKCSQFISTNLVY